jgi:DNA methylase
MTSSAPRNVSNAIANYLASLGRDASIADISAALATRLGPVSPSSIRSCLNLNVPGFFVRTAQGNYRLCQGRSEAAVTPVSIQGPIFSEGLAEFYHADCFEWLRQRGASSVHAVVTDPPYGISEYSAKEQDKLRSGKGGIWRVPPSFDGHKRSPLPRFTVMNAEDRRALHTYFHRLACLLFRVTVPGANILVASNPLVSHIVAGAMSEGGLELRGTIVRLSMTMRGGDRPKNAHNEFADVSVMPRSMWEPWVALRHPLEGRSQDNLRKWNTGGFRRVGSDQPFGDVIRSSPVPRSERAVAPHPSLKPQRFLRQIVRASLPLGKGVILDPFAGSGSTLAAANYVGYESIGIESDATFVELARRAIPALGVIELRC